MKRFILIGWLLVVVTPVPAADMDAVAVRAKGELQQALEELAVTRQQIEGERLPLAQQLRELEQQTLDQRRELERAQRFQENQLVELNVLKTEVKKRTDEVKFLEALLGEYLRGFETRIHVSEMPRYQAVIDTAKAAPAAADLTEAQRIERQTALLDASLQRIAAVTGGELYEGKALSPQGRMGPGHRSDSGQSAARHGRHAHVHRSGGGRDEVLPGERAVSFIWT